MKKNPQTIRYRLPADFKRRLYSVHYMHISQKRVFNFILLNVFYAIDSLYNRIKNRDNHLFESGMILEQNMANTLFKIKEVTEKLDAYSDEEWILFNEQS